MAISACLVIHNEEKVLKRCLDSIASVVDEIIIVHDGPCQDASLEIAARYNARIIIAPRTGIAEPIRPLSYEAARYEWILQIDADEFLSDDLIRALPELAQEKNVDAFEFVWPLFDGRRYRTKHWPYKRSFFRKAVISFTGTGNDFVVQVPGAVKRVPYRLEHQPSYNNYTWRRFFAKWREWAHLQAEAYLADFSTIKTYNNQATDWSNKIQLRRKYPLLITPLDFAIVVIKNMLGGAAKEGFFAWRVVLMWGLYRVMTNWFIFCKKRGLCQKAK